MPAAGKKSAAGLAKVREQARRGDPRGAARLLRRLLADKVQEALDSGDLDKKTAEELVKIGSLLEQLERSGYDLKAAALEITERLADYVNQREPQAGFKAKLADHLAGFYQSLGQEG